MKLIFTPALIGLVLAGLLVSTGHAKAPTNQLSQAEQKSGWKLLFDGKSTAGWHNYNQDKISAGWKVIDGTLVRAEKGAGDIVTDKKYGAFELTLEYNITKGGNSGVMYHVVEGNQRPWHSGPEIQIQDNVDGHDAQKAGWLYQLHQPSVPRWSPNKEIPDATKPAGQWNQLYIRISPQQCEVCMNGVLYYRFKNHGKDWDERVAKSKFAKFKQFAKASEGLLCLQDHGDKVAYRNIKIRQLGPDGEVPQPIDDKLNLKGELAFPNLQWDQWDAINEDGRVRPLRLLELTYAKDDSNRLFVASQYGAIWTFQNQPDVSKSHMLLDLRGKVYDWKKPGANEQGLLGLAMHPNFAANGYFYVYYSHPDNKRSIVSRFTVPKDTPNTADPDSEKIIMEIDQPYQNHNGGCIEFGPDGFLYIGLGDGGDRNDPLAGGQDLSTLLGSLLRIDVDTATGDKPYSIPTDNPFVNIEGAKKEIYAHGLRNPWRFGFDKETGDLWMGDVGQELWEEVNLIQKGGNYGWSRREGTHPFGNRPAVANVTEPIDPVWEYDHRIGKSITGGRVYRSSRMPQLAGKYLYADYVTGRVWALTYDKASGKATKNEQVLPESIPVLSFGEDQNGEVYYLTNSPKGECIYRFSSGN